MSSLKEKEQYSAGFRLSTIHQLSTDLPDGDEGTLPGYAEPSPSSHTPPSISVASQLQHQVVDLSILFFSKVVCDHLRKCEHLVRDLAVSTHDIAGEF